MQELLANTYVSMMIAGALAGAATDISAFRSWKSFEEARAYDWRIASWRWFQGAGMGLIAAAGLGAMQ